MKRQRDREREHIYGDCAKSGVHIQREREREDEGEAHRGRGREVGGQTGDGGGGVNMP